jgi:membrane-bound lytic murein transglycosylase MltF
MKIHRIFKIYLVLLAIAVITMFGLWSLIQSRKYIPRDFEEIRKEGILRVVTSYNSLDYHISGDTIEGFQYDLCKMVEKRSGLVVEIYLENNLETCIQGLLNQEYDVIARNIPITTENRNWLIFTNPVMYSKQVLAQRKQEYNDAPLIRNQLELAKKILYIPQNSPGILRLKNLSEEIADTIFIWEEIQYDSEQLLYMVAKGDIDYAVVDREIASKNKDNLPEIDFETDISFTQLQAWALRKDSPVLLDSLNIWLNEKGARNFRTSLQKK